MKISHDQSYDILFNDVHLTQHYAHINCGVTNLCIGSNGGASAATAAQRQHNGSATAAATAAQRQHNGNPTATLKAAERAERALAGGSGAKLQV